MAGYRIRAFNGVRPRDGAPLMLVCDKKKGLSVLSIRGFDKREELSCDPSKASLHKIYDGPRSDWTGRPLGTWEVDARHEGGVTSFRMRSKGDALALIAWIEKREKKRAKRAAELGGDVEPASSSRGCMLGTNSDAEQYRAYLANLCYRLSCL